MTDNPNPQFRAISVGEPSPFPALPPSQLTVAMTLAHPIPIVIVSLPEVNDDDIASIKSPPEAVALRRSAAMPAGALLIQLKVNETQVWPICVPFLDAAPTMRTWAAQEADTNDMLMVLVDADTRIVRAQRTIGLPPRLLEMARQGIQRAERIDERAAVEELGRLSDLEVWNQATRWKDTGDGVFTMVSEAPVQA
jgi:hypothetical protein